MSRSGGKHNKNGLKPEQMKFQVDQRTGSLQNPDKEPQKEVRGPGAPNGRGELFQPIEQDPVVSLHQCLVIQSRVQVGAMPSPVSLSLSPALSLPSLATSLVLNNLDSGGKGWGLLR